MALGRKNNKAAQRLWRPDFRDAQSLPDTKVIRTGFLLNIVAIALTLSVLTFYVVNEYTLQTVSKTLSLLEAQVAGNTPANRQILDDNKRFKQTAAIIEEVVAFDHAVLDIPVFLKELTATRPDSIIFSVIDMKHGAAATRGNRPPFVIDLSGRIEGVTDATPSQIISFFQRSIGELPSLAGPVLAMDLIRFNRNNQTGHFDFTLQIVIPPESGLK